MSNSNRNGQFLSQIPLDFEPVVSLSREDLVEGKANTTAVTMVDSWPHWPGSVLVLTGPSGSGKTHILNVWAEVANARTISYKNWPECLSPLVQHAQEGGNLAIEDIAQEITCESSLFHLLNAIRQGGGFCLITSSFLPNEWRIELLDLVSRIKGAQTVRLNQPDDELLKAVMFKMFSDRQIFINEKIIDYSILRMERSLDFASRLVSAIDKVSLAGKIPITRALVAHTLSQLGTE